MPALDWALDPNGDGDFSDHLDIVNMSLGSDYAPVDDPENDGHQRARQARRLPVDRRRATAATSPTSAARRATPSASLAVASSRGRAAAARRPEGQRPGRLAGHRRRAGLGRLRRGRTPTAADVTGDVVAIPARQRRRLRRRLAGRRRPRSPARSPGWSGTTTTPPDAAARSRAAGNVQAAGAIGAIFTSERDVFGAGITGSAIIPVFQLPKAAATDRCARPPRPAR